MTDEERYKNVIKIWNQTTEDVTNALMNNLSEINPIYIMSVSGARGGRNQIKPCRYVWSYMCHRKNS